jgi:hypothetical protein
MEKSAKQVTLVVEHKTELPSYKNSIEFLCQKLEFCVLPIIQKIHEIGGEIEKISIHSTLEKGSVYTKSKTEFSLRIPPILEVGIKREVEKIVPDARVTLRKRYEKSKT